MEFHSLLVWVTFFQTNPSQPNLFNSRACWNEVELEVQTRKNFLTHLNESGRLGLDWIKWAKVQSKQSEAKADNAMSSGLRAWSYFTKVRPWGPKGPTTSPKGMGTLSRRGLSPPPFPLQIPQKEMSHHPRGSVRWSSLQQSGDPPDYPGMWSGSIFLYLVCTLQNSVIQNSVI